MALKLTLSSSTKELILLDKSTSLLSWIEIHKGLLLLLQQKVVSRLRKLLRKILVPSRFILSTSKKELLLNFSNNWREIFNLKKSQIMLIKLRIFINYLLNVMQSNLRSTLGQLILLIKYSALMLKSTLMKMLNSDKKSSMI